MPSSRFVGQCRATCAAALLLALLVPSVQGADKKAAQAPAGTKTSVLTPEQLRECLTQKDKLAKVTESAVKTQAAVAASKAEIDSSGKELEEQLAALDRTSEAAVAAHNAKVIERNGRVDAYRAKAEAYNIEAENVLAAKDGYEKTCANRRYDDRDLSDLNKKK